MNNMKSSLGKPAKAGMPMKASNPTLTRVASGKAPKQTITPVKTDRGSFGIKG